MNLHDSNTNMLTYDVVIQSGWADRIVVGDTLWAKILEYPYYYISDSEVVMSFMGEEAVELKKWLMGGRYWCVDLYDEVTGRREHKTIHNLIKRYIAGDRKPFDNAVIRHLDDDPTNNSIFNLEWGTQAQNVEDMRINGKMFMRPVYCFELDRVFSSCAEAADHFGVSRSAVTNCCKGKSHTIGDNYHLCYLDEREDVERNRDLNKYGNFKRVRAINVNSGEIIIFDSRQQASNVLGIPNSAISNVIARRINQTHGWIFEDYEGR